LSFTRVFAFESGGEDRCNSIATPTPVLGM
jgi:hypothetical protein